MQTVADNIKEMANRIKELLEYLLLNHSSIYKWNKPNGYVTSISIDGNYAFNELDNKGRKIQSQLFEEYRRFATLIKVLIKVQPKDTIEEFSKFERILTRIIEQNITWCKTTQEAFEKAVEALIAQFNLINRLYDASNGEVTYIPDTNALLYNTDLEFWEIEKTTRFTMILLPTVLEELDELKINHRNEAVQKKSNKLIRKIKEYRRRGKLTTGVPLVKDLSKLQVIAIEPDMGTTLPWLDLSNNDDRILAGTIEVMRTRPHSPVILVTRDINLQNKAEFANIPFVEPPKPK